MRSKVGPAVMSTRLPFSFWLCKKKALISLKIVSGSAMRPSPIKPLASSPCVASTMMLPKDLSLSMFCLVVGCWYISTSIAGQTITGHLAER